jgi:hypothetical protein
MALLLTPNAVLPPDRLQPRRTSPPSSPIQQILSPAKLRLRKRAVSDDGSPSSSAGAHKRARINTPASEEEDIIMLDIHPLSKEAREARELEEGGFVIVEGH